MGGTLTSVMTMNQSSRPVALILNRAYILNATTMMAIGTSVQNIAISDPPLSRSPPGGTGSAFMLRYDLVRYEE